MSPHTHTSLNHRAQQVAMSDVESDAGSKYDDGEGDCVENRSVTSAGSESHTDAESLAGTEISMMAAGDNFMDQETAVNASVCRELLYKHLLHPNPEVPKLDATKGLLMPVDQSDMAARPCKPVRSIAIFIAKSHLRPDANSFSEMQLTVGSEYSAKSTAAIVSLLFAPMVMGLKSGGTHEEDARAANGAAVGAEEGGGSKKKKKDSGTCSFVDRYMKPGNTSSQKRSEEMFHICVEEVYNVAKECVGFRVWLHIYDQGFSCSAMCSTVIKTSKLLHRSSRVAATMPGCRNAQMTAETARNEKSGMGLLELDEKFHLTAGLQYRRVVNLETWRNLLRMYGENGVHDYDWGAIVNEQEAKELLKGDHRGYGSTHSLSYEVLFNGKTDAGLGFGVKDPMTGKKFDPEIHPDQLDCSKYWNEDGSFKIPEIIPGCKHFFMSTSNDRMSLFELPLPRPASGNIRPGDALLKLFVAEQRRAHRKQQGLPVEDFDSDEDVLGVVGHEGLQDALSDFRSMATGTNQHLKRHERSLIEALRSYDYMLPGNIANTTVTLDPTAKDTFVVETIPATDRVAKETNRIYKSQLQPWAERQRRYLSKYEALLKEAYKSCSDECDDEIQCTDGVYRSFDEYHKQVQHFQDHLYTLKRQLGEYHLKMLKQCFVVVSDAMTIPAGWKGWNNSLDKEVERHRQSASIAFGGGVNGDGRVITGKDRTILGNLRDFLDDMFSTTVKVHGRNTKPMHFIYSQVFYTVSDFKFRLMLLSEAGKGKSMRVERMKRILPPDTVTNNISKSEMADMNGDNLADNGKVITNDELPAYLLAPTCGKQLAVEKTIATEGICSISRTVKAKGRDGQETHVTSKVVTHDFTVNVTCSNEGENFTQANQEPDQGKRALISRSFAVHVRAESTTHSPKEEFEAQMEDPSTIQRVSDFRLYTTLVWWCCLAVRNCPWLQTDLSFAEAALEAGDVMLEREYGMPRPVPRVMQKRSKDLQHLCYQEAVAKVYLFMNTAYFHEVGRPSPDGNPPPFLIEHLYECIRIAVPTREMIGIVWSDALEYSIGTSTNGVNVMTAISESFGITMDRFFRSMPSSSAQAIVTPSGGAQQSDADMQNPFVSLFAKDSPDGRQCKLSRDAIESNLQHMRAKRREINKYRRMACGMDTDKTLPMDAVKQVVGRAYDSTNCAFDASGRTEDCAVDVALEAQTCMNYVMPDLNTVCLFNDFQAVVKWSVGLSARWHSDIYSNTVHTNAAMRTHENTQGPVYAMSNDKEGSAASYNFAWLALKVPQHSKEASGWTNLGAHLSSSTAHGKRNSMHVQCIADAAFKLASPENSRNCPECPKMPFGHTAQDAWTDPNGQMLRNDSLAVQLRPLRLSSGNSVQVHETHHATETDCRSPDGINSYANVPIHRQVDQMIQYGRLPNVLPFVSSRINKTAPIVRVSQDTFHVNTAVIVDHVNMLLEAAYQLSGIPGLRGKQERYYSGQPGAPTELRAKDAPHARYDMQTGECSILPFCCDMVPMAWTIDFQSRFYNDEKHAALQKHNEFMRGTLSSGGGASSSASERVDSAAARVTIKDEELPEFTLPYNGFFDASNAADCCAAAVAISIPVPSQRPENQAIVSTTAIDGSGELSEAALRAGTQRSLNKITVTEDDIERHRRTISGKSWMHGIKGDLYSWTTWKQHTMESQKLRGNFASDSTQDAAKDLLLDGEMLLCLRRFEVSAANSTAPFQLELPGLITYRATEQRDANQSQFRTKRKEIQFVSDAEKRYLAKAAQVREQTSINSMDVLCNYPKRRKQLL